MTPEKPGFSTTTTVSIALILIIPFLIRSVAPALEPYPAIVLPLGVGIFNIDNNKIDIKSTQIMGQTENGDWERIEPRRFLDPIPPYYIYKIAESNFGLIPQEKKEINTAFWGRVEVPRKPVTTQNIVSTRKWIRYRLNSLGYQDSVLRLRESLMMIDLETDSLISETIVEEIDFELD